MRFYNRIFLTEHFKSDLKAAEKIIKHLRKKKRVNDAYVLTLKSKGGLLDVIHTPELSKKYYPEEELVVIGLAEDRDSAFELAGEIVMEVYENTGAFDVFGYFGKEEEN